MTENQPVHADPGAVRIVTEPIPLAQVIELAEAGFGDLVKAVVDVERRALALGGELHADAEAMLLDAGSRQAHLWGINLYPARYGTDEWIEYDALINIRPRQGNPSREVADPGQRRRIADVVRRLVSDQ